MKSCHFYRIAQCSSKNSMTLSPFPMTFPWRLLFSMTFQAWKMVFLNSMTFHDQGAPCNVDQIIPRSKGHAEVASVTASQGERRNEGCEVVSVCVQLPSLDLQGGTRHVCVCVLLPFDSEIKMYMYKRPCPSTEHGNEIVYVHIGRIVLWFRRQRIWRCPRAMRHTWDCLPASCSVSDELQTSTDDTHRWSSSHRRAAPTKQQGSYKSIVNVQQRIQFKLCTLVSKCLSYGTDVSSWHVYYSVVYNRSSTSPLSCSSRLDNPAQSAGAIRTT